MLKQKRVFARQCDWCKKEIILNGPDKDPFVITAAWKFFCTEQRPGKPATRDCMAAYLNNIKKKENELSIKKELEQEKRQEEKEKKMKSMPRVLAKLDALQKEFKDREWKRRLSKHPS